MGKHKHSKDRQFITQSEYKNDWGGKKDPSKVPMATLPYYCCALGLQPFENPVCTSDGIVYDLVNIIPFIKKFKQCPVTGKPLKVADLIKLNFHKNAHNEYHDPISFKAFTNHTKIVAIKTSGNVYSADTVEELNKKAKNWKDLITSQSFTSADVLIIQDPKDLHTRTISQFDHVSNNVKFNLVQKPEKMQDFINQNSTSKKIIEAYSEENKKQEEIKRQQQLKEAEELKQIIQNQESNQESSVQDFIDYALKTKLYKHSRETTKNQSISVTTTASNAASGVTEYRTLTESEIRKKIYDIVKGRAQKGYITIKTNLGDLNFKLHCDFAPITCENFLELAQKKYYDNMKFHRLVQDFMLQGGDPTGTGRGGNSIFEGKFQDEFHPKLTHSDPGILSMANSGPNTNGSQFFVTLSDCHHLDNKHSIFGEIMGGNQTLYKINKTPVQKEKPLEDIVMEQVIIHANPFREAIKLLKEEQKKTLIKQDKVLENQKQRERWIEDIKGFEPIKKQKLEGGQEVDVQQNKDKKVVRAGVLDQILGMGPSQIQKQKRTNFNFSNW